MSRKAEDDERPTSESENDNPESENNDNVNQAVKNNSFNLSQAKRPASIELTGLSAATGNGGNSHGSYRNSRTNGGNSNEDVRTIVGSVTENGNDKQQIISIKGLEESQSHLVLTSEAGNESASSGSSSNTSVSDSTPSTPSSGSSYGSNSSPAHHCHHHHHQRPNSSASANKPRALTSLLSRLHCMKGSKSRKKKRRKGRCRSFDALHSSRLAATSSSSGANNPVEAALKWEKLSPSEFETLQEYIQCKCVGF